jgi:hypothetical protein
MQRLYFLLSTIVPVLFLTGCATSTNAQPQEVKALGSNPPANCPVTLPDTTSFKPAIPSLPTEPFPGEFWFGFESLWTSLPSDGVWSSLPHNADEYTQKIFWWSEYFSLKDEPEPDLVVFGDRLDEKALPLNVSKATNAFADDIGTAMLVGVDFPTSGCWEITGRYKKTGLTFVIWIEP